MTIQPKAASPVKRQIAGVTALMICVASALGVPKAAEFVGQIWGDLPNAMTTDQGAYFITLVSTMIGACAMLAQVVLCGIVGGVLIATNGSTLEDEKEQQLRNFRDAMIITMVALMLSWGGSMIGLAAMQQASNVSGLQAAAFTQLNEMPRSEAGALANDFRLGRMRPAIGDTTEVLRIKYAYRTFDDRHRVALENFIDRSAARTWDVKRLRLPFFPE